ncbi:MAG: hypothetical protein Q8N83_07280 [Ignavibacteria bacterium]|nr:hypothetical protein [Ignavibacteria bacterium]
MYSALLYKEWLKIRWAFFSMVFLTMLTLMYIALNMSSYNEFMTAKGFWGNVILLGFPFFTDIKYIPLLIGVVIAIVQFSPEMNLSRLKLTLHLPADENKLLLQMISLGFMLLTILFFLIAIILWAIVGIYFPAEVVAFVLSASFPWLVVGVASYFLTAAIILEPVWARRLILIPFALGFLDIYLSIANTHLQLITFLVFAAIVSSLLILFSGYHFKRGIK